MRTAPKLTLAILATAALAIPATALVTAAILPPRVETITYTVPVVQADPAVTAYGDAVKALRDAGEAGNDLTPHLIHLAEVDNSIRFN